jgi:opine dehydrogenase
VRRTVREKVAVDDAGDARANGVGLMNVAVLGAGGGGLAVAYEWASQGHRVSLYAQRIHDHHLAPVRERGGIQAEGLLEGFVPLETVTSDIAEALEGVEVVFVVGPAYATEPFGADTRGHLHPGMAVVVCPSSCVGSLAFKRAAGVDLYDESIVVGETSTLPYASRASLHASVRIFHRFDTGLWAAAAPRSNTPRLLEVLRRVYRNIEEAAGVFQTTLQNGNPVIHPAVTLLNAALIERTGGDFMFYQEGVTEAVGRLMKAVDDERLAIARALGVAILAEPDLGVRQGYMTEANYSTGYSTAPGFRGIKAQNELHQRYLTEDVGYSMVFLTDLARHLSVPTPTMDAVIHIASIVAGEDFAAGRARTMDNMGLSGLTREQLAAL